MPPTAHGGTLDLKKLTPGEMVIGVSGILLLIVGVLFDWFGIDINIAGTTVADYSEKGLGNFWTLIAIIIGVVMAGHVIVDKVAGVEMPERLGKVGWGVFYLAGGIIAFLFTLVAVIVGVEERGVDLDPKIGAYLGLLLTLGLAVGGFLVSRERGHLQELMGGGATGGGGSTPPPAPPSGEPPVA